MKVNVSGKTVGILKCVSKGMGGGRLVISTNAFLKVKKSNLRNLSNTNVFYVHEKCLKNLVRAKRVLLARKSQKSIFGAIDLSPSLLPQYIV